VIEAQVSHTITKRDGRIVLFDSELIYRAIEKAFRAELALGAQDKLDEVTQVQVGEITRAVLEETLRQAAGGERIEVEAIQDVVERHLMKHGDYAVARRYIVYREERKKARTLRGDTDVHESA
jgi:ribonucleoside-diphosphate reductase alpha chain